MYDYAVRPEKKSEKNKTGIPDGMKSRFERSSGLSLGDVRVHYNSEKPAQLRAHAYTQGSEVYVAPGQEKHLPHELGHVVQQKSDMVRPTGEIGGVPLNTDEALESGADRIAEKAENTAPVQAKFKDGVIQMDAAGGGFYNISTGLSSILGLAGVGFGIYNYYKNNQHERKHRYIEEVEKYADAACDAQEELIGVPLAEDGTLTPKAKKLKYKVARNLVAALQKAQASGEDIDYTTRNSLSAQSYEVTIKRRKINNKNIFNAVLRAEKAYTMSLAYGVQPAADNNHDDDNELREQEILDARPERDVANGPHMEGNGGDNHVDPLAPAIEPPVPEDVNNRPVNNDGEGGAIEEPVEAGDDEPHIDTEELHEEEDRE